VFNISAEKINTTRSYDIMMKMKLIDVVSSRPKCMILEYEVGYNYSEGFFSVIIIYILSGSRIESQQL